MTVKRVMWVGVLMVIAFIAWFMLQEEEAVCRIVSAEQTHRITREDLGQMGHDMTFRAVIRSSGKKPVEADFTGIELVTLLESLGMADESIKRIRFIASDGYEIAIGADEMLEPKNVYLTYMRDGSYLKSKKFNGGGPFQLIIRKDPFSQRWIKHVIEIRLE